MGRLLYWTDVAGQDKRVQKSFSLGDLTEMTAEQIEAKRKQAIVDLEIFKPAVDVASPDSFAERAEDWLKYELPKLRHAESPRYYVTKYLVPAFRKMAADSITPDVVNKWIGQVRLEDGSKPAKSTLRHLVSQLKLIVPKLAGADIKYPSDCKPEEDTYCPTDEEVNRMLAASKGWFRVLILILIMTGMRISECLGLQIEDVDIEHSVLYIRRGAVGGKLGPTKSRNSRRVVSVHRSFVDEVALLLNGRHSGPVFRSRKGTPRRQSNLHKRQWTPMLKAAGLAAKAAEHEHHFGFHSLRHYSVSYCLRAGMSFDDVKLRHGHGSERIMRRYLHLAPGHDSRILACVPNPLAVTSVATSGNAQNAA